MDKEAEEIKVTRENIRKNIEGLQKGQKALEDAIELLKILDKIK